MDVEVGIADSAVCEARKDEVDDVCNIDPPSVTVTDEVGNNEENSNALSSEKPQSVKVAPKTEAGENVKGQQDSSSAPAKVFKGKRFYPGDVVVKKAPTAIDYQDWQPAFGTVLKPAGFAPETAKSSVSVSPNDFHVHWDLLNRIQVTKGSEVALVDRMLLRGQRVENKNGLIGTVMDFKISASVQINGTNHVVERVPLHRLHPISHYVRGQEVLLNGWVGVVTSIKRNVWFRMDGGLVFHMETTESDGFTRADPYWGLGVSCPGMRTRLPSDALKMAKWSSTPMRILSRFLPIHYLYTWAYSTIIRTEVIAVNVKWLQPAPGSNLKEQSKPPLSLVERTDLNQLLVIGSPSTETIGINSVRRLRILPHDELTTYNVWIEAFRKRLLDDNEFFEYSTTRPSRHPPLKALVESVEDETPVKVLLRHNLVTVQWEDGTVENMPAIKVPLISPTADDGEFPMGLVVAPLQKDSQNGNMYGVVMESNALAKSRTRKVNVRWILNGKDEGVRAESVFDIKPHNVFSLYHRGTIVFPRDPSTSSFPAAVVIDVNVFRGKMIVIKASDQVQDEIYPHQVMALGKRCHWSFFSRTWIVDDLILPPYQLELAFDPAKRLVDVSEQKYNVLDVDTNNPQDETAFTTLWDEPSFELVGFAPLTHRYHAASASENFGRQFAHKIAKEIEYLKGNVPEGVWVRCYQNRLDLVSVLMVGPTKTPYEDGIFLFDMQLPATFPVSRPAIHYVSYTLELHPLLSFDGNVCVNAIPWDVTETSEHAFSYIALFLSRLQALIFTPTPYFANISSKNEGNTERGEIKARMYNQGVFVRVLDSAWNMLQNPHEPWEKNIRNHFASVLTDKISGFDKWVNIVKEDNQAETSDTEEFPSFPLLPVPEGLKIALNKRIELFKKLMSDGHSIGGVQIESVTDTTADSESQPVARKESEGAARLLTPIAEMTEPSSSSTFGGKQSAVSVASDDPEHPPSLDSLKNVKQRAPKKVASPKEQENEHQPEQPQVITAE